MDTEAKLAELESLFPSYNIESLLEILIMCDGSVECAKSIIMGNTDTKHSISTNTIERDPIVEHQPLKKRTRSSFCEDAKKSCKEITIKTEKFPSNSDQVTPSQCQCKKRSIPEYDHDNESKAIKVKKPAINSLMVGRNTDEYNSKQSETNQTITLRSKAEIESALPNIRLFKNFLHKDLSNEILMTLSSQKMLFKAKQFYIAGKLCKSSQKSIVYSISGDTEYDPVYSGPGGIEHHPPPSLTKCQAYIEAKINEVLLEVYNQREVPEYMITENWKADFCVGNYYPNNKSHLDWHSDKLTNIGPLATIASISFGANRIFRLRRSFPTNSTIYNIPLPNNTLLIMLPSTQELYKHCVPSLKNSLLSTSDIVGEERFNLTFRYYVWMCMASFKGAECKGFKYADFKLNLSGVMNLETNKKSEATRWLSPSETVDKSVSL
ncbi:hypothetical protein CANINC_001524 [Pichia inconspicua]|uniref:Fe2OG dioxygenase domain-containing protein n=1 Tax=Pichia inconspicua TaxID=52247 RepID=A0A4T0X3T2_9ASCO|nr:hypothetical protein CANINC_001524 [[Candida] inconspicua]